VEDLSKMMDFGAQVLEPGSANGTKQVPPQFNPYQDNGGTVASIAGDDYVIIAADTRFTLGYSIPTRKISRILKMYDDAAKIRPFSNLLWGV